MSADTGEAINTKTAAAEPSVSEHADSAHCDCDTALAEHKT
jgi:hypothetical protein